MSFKKRRLAIVQNKITQFDEPLYNKLLDNISIELMVYYTEPLADKNKIDPEIGRLPSWHCSKKDELYPCIVRKTGFINGLKMLFIILKGKYDLVIICGYNSILHLLIIFICKLAGIPVGLRSDNILLYRNVTDWKWKFKDLLYPIFFKCFTTFHPTGSLAAEYMSYYGISNNRMFYFPYNVDNDKLKISCRSSTNKQQIVRVKLGIDVKDQVVLGVIKFVDREDPLTLLNGFAIISKEKPGLHLILVGDGVLREKLEKVIIEKNIQNVHLVGYVSYEDLPCYYGLANVFVHPAISGSWEVSVNEAMVCGVPVIASDRVGSAYDLIVSGKTGEIFKAASPVSLGQKLRKLLDDPNLKQNYAPYLHEKMTQWNYEQTINNLIGALRFINDK